MTNKIKVGDIFQYGRKEYEVIGVFEEDNEIPLFWCRCKDTNGYVKYSNVFTYDENNKLYKRS